MARNRCAGSNFVWWLGGVGLWLCGFLAGYFFATTPSGHYPCPCEESPVITRALWGPVRRRYRVNFQDPWWEDL